MLGRRVSRRLALPGRTRATRLLAGTAVLLLVAAVAAAVVEGRGGVSVAVGTHTGPVTVTSAPPVPMSAAAVVVPLPADAPQPAVAALAAVLDPLAANPSLGTFTGRVTDAATGAVLWESRPEVPQEPASTMKILTTAAALLTLGVDDEVPTRVVATDVPGQVAIVGGGDVTLSAQPAGSPTYYPGAPRLDDLVAQVRASGVSVTSVVVDTRRWSGDGLAPGWSRADVAGGYTAPVEALMLDGARSKPLVEDPPRSATPALDAGRTFAQRLGLAPAAVTAGPAPDGARQLAEVRSAPLRTRAEAMLVRSDNLQAEAIGREVALARGQAPTFAGAAAAVSQTLAAHGIDVTGLTGLDTSGLSVDDRIPARLLSDVVAAAAGSGPLSATLRPLLTWLPVAGATGTLANRYGGSRDAAPSSGAGFVRAKTGTLDGVSSLAGTVADTDGRVLGFALMSTGASPAVTRPALDAIATALRSCGCR
ncbi:D-alanyl-D-alanine carboxypeptidase/D-alanyl-D-alanine-endopeptidase [Rhodococcus antarcticus]|uniref:D-alanyl-D-alanine carboxypeptidase/D-alanyl-D-alanine-endopeptidase n=1 Tax=Rhodococcus antarcticus TaxID=2987751 RepID=A0ABY6NZI1_9NOCA|nr:D-alanyl-D-alanine carboxypeptidase/D-alanyl-D-alanine-endopeptidase [Rhodococcus antarcticus]UZJ24431.1 D-alanyl-D-alanine carboxypeptidase/D-alanyl-D-alanine-endopeptidase [Rhodococcus antarcticus]